MADPREAVAAPAAGAAAAEAAARLARLGEEFFQVVNINGNDLNVEVLGPDDAPVLIAHHGGGGIGSLAEPKATFGPLADIMRVVVFDARGLRPERGQAAVLARPVGGGRRRAARVARGGRDRGGRRLLRRLHRHGVGHRVPRPGPAMILRDTSADRSNLDRAYENARNQTRVQINWDNFDRYWGGRIRDDEDLKARWAEIIPLYDFEYDPVRSAERVEAGIYRHEAHNWCFTRNMPGYDLRPQLPGVRCPTLVTVGRADWVTPVSSAETIAALIPDSRLVVFEKSGHSPQFEEFDRFQEVMRGFVREVFGARPA